MMMVGGYSSESCIITYDVEIWDAANRTKKAAFKTTGESTVFLFAYQTALENAIFDSIEHMMGYLKEGKTDYLN